MDSALRQIDRHPVEQVPVGALTTGGSPRLAGESLAHVEVLVASGAELPPIIVHRPTMRVIDGMHRLRAAQLMGRDTIAVRFFDGAEADAFVLAVKANIAHGLPLSLADRKHAAGRIIRSHPHWSDRMIASVSGISARTVAELRRAAGAGSAGASGRVGRDGRVRSIDVTAGRRLAGELIARDPSLSLRQVARAAGISPETVRDVRKRVLRGEDPLPAGRPKPLLAQGTASAGAAVGSAAAPVVRRTGCGQSPAPDLARTPPSAAVVQRLKADPALRLNENGRDLLRLLNIHTLRAEDWTRMLDSIPPHCRGIVAQLARDCAEKWAELASRIESKASNLT